jgi:hypothetical protein
MKNKTKLLSLQGGFFLKFGCPELSFSTWRCNGVTGEVPAPGVPYKHLCCVNWLGILENGLKRSLCTNKKKLLF